MAENLSLALPNLAVIEPGLRRSATRNSGISRSSALGNLALAQTFQGISHAPIEPLLALLLKSMSRSATRNLRPQ
jgi:hypothetical protein